MRIKSSPAELVVGSSQDIDDDLSDDVEEVFIRDGRGGKCRDIENKPLMPSRKKYQHRSSKTTQQLKSLKKQYKRSRCSRCLEPCCYALLIIVVILIFCAIVLTLFPVQRLRSMLQNASPIYYDTFLRQNAVDSSDGMPNGFQQQQQSSSIQQVPCQNVAVTKVWSRTIAKINSEAPLRKTDLNGDGIDDIVAGFGVDDSLEFEAKDIPQCTRNGQTDLCEGGIFALNGRTGEVMWHFWSAYAIFSLFCRFDVNGDNINDCIISGPGGLLNAVDGRTGKLIWESKEYNLMKSQETYDSNAIDLYTINMMRDLDSDGINDIIAAHTDDSYGIREGHIRLISGKTGKIFRSIPAPFKEEIFVPVQLMTLKDGTEYLLVLTGGQNTAGGVYKIRLESMKNFNNDNDYTTIQRSSSGFLVPAVLTDINGDNVDDFVVSSFNSTIYAFDGQTNQVIWTFTFPSSESISSIVPGKFNHDNVTDFMIKYSTGPGFPIYYYSQTTILNGIDGKSFLENKITDSGGPHSPLGGISIAQNNAGDLFLHFQTHCRDKFENARDPYKFVPDTDIIQQSRADICMLRYNTSTVVKLQAVSRHVEPPGALIFTSDDVFLQLNQSDNSKLLRQPFKHPKMRIKQQQQQQQNRFAKPLQNAVQPQPIQQTRPPVQPAEVQAQTDPPPPPPIEVNKKQSNVNEQRQIMKEEKQKLQAEIEKPLLIQDQAQEPPQQEPPQPIVVEEGKKDQEMKLREKELDDEILERRNKLKQKNSRILDRLKEIESNIDDDSGTNNYEKGSMIDNIQNELSKINVNQGRLLDNTNNRANFDDNNLDYDEYYDTRPQTPHRRRYMQSIRRNNNWKTNRDTRSEDDGPSKFANVLHDDVEVAEKHDDLPVVKKVLDDSEIRKASQPLIDPRRETLWDIEIEKENDENQKIINRKRRDIQLNQNVLPAVSSTGVLVESLNKSAANSIDFVFVLNVRESETFPPLLLPSDLQCVEERMASLNSFPADIELIDIQKNVLKECLKSRLISPESQDTQTSSRPSYETQITIVRISISCTCNDLKPQNEVCSTFKSMKDQRWSEFMGNQLDGTY